MFKPLFNKVLVEINDQEAKWGSGSNDNLGGEVYREGKVLSIGLLTPTKDYPCLPSTEIFNDIILNNTVMWHEGHEAGTVFEDNGKKYALIYWWDVAAVNDEQ